MAPCALCTAYVYLLPIFLLAVSLSLSLFSVCLSYWEEKENMDSDFRCQAKWDGPFKDTTRHTAQCARSHQAFASICVSVCLLNTIRYHVRCIYIHGNCVCFSSLLHQISFLFRVTLATVYTCILCCHRFLVFLYIQYNLQLPSVGRRFQPATSSRAELVRIKESQGSLLHL